MKIKYLAMLATASIVSLGLVTACANPCAAKDNNEKTEEQLNPCAAKENPCAAKENPCAGQ